MDTKKTLFRNTVTSFISQFILLGIGIITMPYIVHKLGDSEYGIISVVMVFIGYLSFMDLGIGWAVVKFVAEYNAYNEREEIRKIIETSISVFLAGSVAVIIIVFLLSDFLVRDVFNIPEHLRGVSIIAFKLASVGFMFNMLASIYGSVLNGYQRFDITNLIRVIYGLINILGTVFLLYSGYGLLEVVIWNFIATLLNFVLLFVFARRINSAITIAPRFFKNTFNKILSFSVYTIISKIGLQLIYNLEKAFISSFLPIKMLTYYIIPFNVASKVTVVCTTLGSVIYPAFSAFEAMKEREKVRDLFLKAQKYIFAGVYPITFILFFFAEKILEHWMGIEYALKGGVPLKILSVAFLINSITSEDAILFDGIGKPRISAVIVTISGILNILFAFIFIKLWGINGASFALFSSVTICGFGLMYSTKQILGIGMIRRFADIYFVPLLFSLITLPFIYYFSRFINGLISLIIMLIISLLILYLILFLSSFSKQERIDIINNVIGVFRFKSGK